MSSYSSIKITEIFVQIRDTEITLNNFEESAKQITSVISKPSQSLNISKVSSHTLIPTGAYYVPNDIVVMEASELVIEPGVILYFAQGTGIVSYGKLTAIGSPDNLIIITGDNWANISIIGESSKKSSIVNTIIEGGQSRIDEPTNTETFRSLNDILLGGNLYLENSNLNMKNCIVLNGYAGFGGGLFLYNSTIDFEDIIIFNNEGKNSVGGIELLGLKDSSTIKNSYVIKNTGFSAGGIYAHGGIVVMDNLTVMHNLSRASCGGVKIDQDYADQFCNIRIINSLIEENFGVTCGGLFYGSSQPITDDIITNVIKNNSNKSGQSPNLQQYQS